MEAIQAYLARYPGGPHAVQARAKLEAVKNTEKPSIAFPKFEGDSENSTAIAPILKYDLGQSGRFRLIDTGEVVTNQDSRPALADWRAKGAQYFVAGSATKLAGGKFNVSFRLWNTTNGQELGGQRLKVDEVDMRLAAHRISDYLHEKILATPSDFSRRVAHVSQNGSTYKLVISDYDSANPQTALTSRKPIGMPVWSTNGKYVAYISLESGQPAGYLHDLGTGKRSLVKDLEPLISSACKPEFDRLQAGSFGFNDILSRDDWIKSTSEECKTTMVSLFVP
jgi:TolB protein